MSVYCDDDKTYEFSLPFYLMVLMSKMRDKTMFKSDFTKPVVVNMLYDTMTESIMQFGLFLRYHYSDNHSVYNQLLPENSLSVMAHLKVSPEVAFKIFRPSVKYLHKMEAREWEELVQLARRSFDDFAVEKRYGGGRALSDTDVISGFIVDVREKAWESMSAELYTTFWMLEPDNVHVPVDA